MGKPTTARRRYQIGSKSDAKAGKRDEDTAIFIYMSKELKQEGKRLYQKHDHEGAMSKYEKALKLLPPNHIDVASLRTNMAACYMQMGIGELPRAVNECNLALQVAPKYSKALLKRARCYEALNRLDLALTDVSIVLSMEPNNATALEIAENVRKGIEKGGLQTGDKEVVLPHETVHPPVPPPPPVPGKIGKEKGKRKKNTKLKTVNEVVEKKTEHKVVVEEKVLMKSVKLVHGEDIRGAQLPVNCAARLLRDIVVDRFPSLMGVLIKYKDQEGDLVTITTTDELRVAEGLVHRHGFLRLYIAEVSPDKEPIYEGTGIEEALSKGPQKPLVVTKNIHADDKGSTCIEDWIVQFASLFKSHVGFDCDSYMDIHQMGMKLYSEALEDTVTSKEAQELFDIAAAKFRELTALALFNWGNVHLSKARKRMASDAGSLSEATGSSVVQVKDAYDWAQKQYTKAGMKYEEALKVKPDFYEGYLALGLQQFEQVKLSWYYVLGSKSDLDIGSCSEILELYNKAEDSMEKGMQIWEEIEEQRLNGISKYETDKALFQKFGLGGLFKDISADEASEQAKNMRSQINLLWGTMLYERSVVEYKLSLQTWEECLEVAVEKFELAGASETDITVLIKNHCSNDTALEGFKVDELVQAWNEINDSDRWRSNVTSSHMEPLFRRRSSDLHSAMENFE
ncbi:protein PHOX1-like [Salvia hispanica]|uniref:protein PHOX1-like n=1 Tax=Salvia hispanica TaxID=49212 RepID=UPI0020099385|nr:protein PHOX1-like [Salvia hispanica]